MDKHFDIWLKSRSKHAPTLTKSMLIKMEIAFIAGKESEKKRKASVSLKHILEAAKSPQEPKKEGV